MSQIRTQSRNDTQLQNPETLAYRLHFSVTIALAAGTVVIFILYLMLALNWRSQPFIGVMLNNALAVNKGLPVGDVPWAGLQQGMRAGDQLVKINGVTLQESPGDFASARRTYELLRSGFQVGDTVDIEYMRPPDNTVFNVSYPLTSFDDTNLLVFFIIPYGTGLVIMIMGLLVLWFRRNDLPGLISATVCFSLAIFMGGLFDLGTTLALSRVWLLAAALFGASVAALGLVFPRRFALTYRYPLSIFAPYLLALGVILIAQLTFDTTASGGFGIASQWSILMMFLGTGILCGSLIWHRQRALTRLIRDQASMMLLGVVLGAIPGLLWLSLQDMGGVPISLEAMMPFLITPVLGIVVAIFQWHQVDTDWLFSQAITYGILLLTLMIGYFLLILGASFFALQILPNDPLLIAFTLFTIAVLFVPIRTALQARIDRIYFRRRFNYQERLESFGREISSLSGNENVIKLFRGVLNDTLMPESVFIFLPNVQSNGDFTAFGEASNEQTDITFSHESDLTRFLRTQGTYGIDPARPIPTDLLLDHTRLAILRTRILSGLVTGDSLAGILSVGAARSGKPYTHEEIRFVEGLTAQVAIAVERAHVIESLEQRVLELNVLSQVGQAVNFTIEFDDLLELISTRTSRLIESSHFYIALHEEAHNQMYFAFFLENDERYPEKENIRWRLGSDLFSDIVRTAQPRRVDDYAKATVESGDEIPFDSQSVRAWMGVPLIAGSNTLGTMAVGKTKAGEVYTDDQLRIFGNIGVLAATSIEKARLFSEVNVRARQLAALNEVSQKLVLAEGGELEELLNLITSSAVSILNAEAGSLLLAADDETNDMVFRVAIGGTGGELVGKRIKSDHGLVGEVVRTGKSVIVNNARQDQRWKGEVAKSETFRTEAILAVPLTAKDRIIGVLEVLNKKDGTVYVDEEVELLMTLAGQAAIAIENARLFQMTGSQLNKRLEELETLERIDFELNRTLNIQHVAEITVHWTVASSNAVAAALGLVIRDAAVPYLNILAMQGYDAGEYPDGADNQRWPLDKGIVKRVMRTLQPDLADPKIDPDYVPSLRDSISQITLPMISGGEIKAILILETNKEPRFNLLDLAFVQRIAEHASIAVDNALLLQKLQFAAESKSEFVGFAAHELKNPLASVKGYASILTNPAMLAAMGEDMKEKAVTTILSNAERMEAIINDLRDVAALDANKLNMTLRPIPFYKVVEDTLLPFERQIAEKEQTVVNNVRQDLPLITGDHTRLVQVLTNLVSNAHKYSPPETTITITAEVNRNFRTKQGQHIGAVLHVKIIDQGIGMDEKDLSRIFQEDYFRSDNEKAREQKGTGLGMMITQRFIEGHGGKIWVESQLNLGSTFQFVIPLAPETPLEGNPDDYKAPTQVRNGQHQTETRLRPPSPRQEEESASD